MATSSRPAPRVIACARPGRERPARRSSSADLLTRGVGGAEIELGRIERTADPFEIAVVLFVVRIGDRLEEIRIAGDAADVLGWAGVLTVDADRELQSVIRPGQFLDDD